MMVMHYKIGWKISRLDGNYIGGISNSVMT